MPKGLDYIINLKDGDFGGAKKAKSEMSGLDAAVSETEGKFHGMKEVIGEVGGMIAAAFAVEKIFDFGKESLGVYRSTEAAAAQVTAGIKSTAGIAGESLDELKEKAEELEKKTLFSEAQTLNADAMLVTFTNIRGKIFDEAIPAIENLATRMGGDGPADLKGASIQVGKALNDPMKGIIALHRVGVEFSDAQKEMIATDLKHGEMQKAQAVILKELQTEFGGSAEAARKVLGAQGDLNEETEQLKKGFGELVSDGLGLIIPAMVDVVHGLKDGVHWIQENKSLLQDVIIVVGSAAAAYAIYEGALLAMEAPMAIMTAAQWALDAAMDANPVGMIVVGIGLLVGGLILAYKHSETFRAVLSGIGEVAQELSPIFKGLGEIILGAFTLDPAEIAKGFKDTANGIKKVIDDGGIGGAFTKGYNSSIAASKKDEETEAAKNKTTASALVGKPGANNSYSISTGKSKKGGDSTTLSGGRSVRNVQVTIGKLVERLEVHTTNIQGLRNSDIQRQLTEFLTGVVHDSELALGSQ